MPLPQVISAGLELTINKLLSLDPDALSKVSELSGKRCDIKPLELGFTLSFIFAQDKVIVTSPQKEDGASARKPVTSKSKNKDSCVISLSLFAIPELQDMNNITRLIREEKLDFEGDLGIAQAFADVFKQIDIDLEEEISKYLGDVAAHTLVQNARKFHGQLLEQAKLSINALSEAMLDEKPVAVRAIMIENFNQDVSDLENDMRRLESRLSRLENK